MGIKKHRWFIYVLAAMGISAILGLLAWWKQKRSGNVSKNALDLNARMRVEEYRSLREEINAILQRGYYIYFSTLTLALGLVGYGISIDEILPSVFVILSPIPILHLGFLLILEQVRTVRRNASYIRAFHEGEETGIFWETRLHWLRKSREKKPKKREVTVADILKEFPTVIDLMSALCLIIAWIRYFVPIIGVPLEQLSIYWWIGTAILVLFPVILTVILAHYRNRQSATLQGAGKVEDGYMQIWQFLKEKTPLMMR